MVVSSCAPASSLFGGKNSKAEQGTLPLEQRANSHLSSVPYHVLAGQAESIAAIFSSSLGTTTGLLPNDAVIAFPSGAFNSPV